MTVTRGFVGRARNSRLPPGQYDVGSSWPVLTAEATPKVDAATWTVTIDGLVSATTTWTLAELRELPPSSYAGDIHCVTTWSKLDTTFDGVSLDTLLEVARPLPTATHMLATSTTGYTTNLPLADISGDQAWLVWQHDGRELPREHGGPVRMLVPHLYFWKSAKWIERITLLDHDQLGFWEVNGYHRCGDPWREQRFDGD